MQLSSRAAAFALLTTAACSPSSVKGGGSDLAGLCVGGRPPAAAYSATPGPRRSADGGEVVVTDGGCAVPLCPGAAPPAWALRDFQPTSCGYGATWGPAEWPEIYKDHVVVLALWAGW